MSGTTHSRRYGPPERLKGDIRPLRMVDQETEDYILDQERTAAYYEAEEIGNELFEEDVEWEDDEDA